jgi:hypothetical protein
MRCSAIATSAAYGAEFVTTEKGYLLMFFLTAPDPPMLGDLEKSLHSIHFVKGAS